MSITPLATIITLPEKCPMQEIQGMISEVYELGEYNGKPKQNFLLKDSSGTVCKGTAWGHGDLSTYKGKEVIIKAGPKGGLNVNNYGGKPGFSVSAFCTFQSIAGGAAPSTQSAPQKAANQTESTQAKPVQGSVKPVQGMTIGMAINNACNSLTEQHIPLTKLAIWKLASMIVKVAVAMESGNLYEEPAKPTEPVEDVPYSPAESHGEPPVSENEPF